jgi:methylphosphotriester-DNA--protein-cysteine methyltransferase
MRSQPTRRAAPHGANDQHRDNLVAHTTRGLDTLSTENLRGRRPDIQLLYHAWQTTHTTFRDRRPDVPPLELEPQRRTTQLPAAQAAQGKLLVDHGRRTNIRGRRPGLKVKNVSSETSSTEPTASPH